MSNSPEESWSEDPNAPQIPPGLYLAEKEAFAGLLIGTVFYGTPSRASAYACSPCLLGIVVALFFQCLGVLFRPTKPIGGATKWALVVHTTAMFSFLTITFGIDINYEFLSYINNRKFPGSDEFPPGPVGYEYILDAKATSTVLVAMFPLSQWLADGLLVGPTSNSADPVFDVAPPPAAPLLYHLFHESLGHGFPMPDVPRLVRYVLKPSTR